MKQDVQRIELKKGSKITVRNGSALDGMFGVVVELIERGNTLKFRTYIKGRDASFVFFAEELEAVA